MKILFRSWNETDLQYYYFENGEYFYLDEDTQVPIGEMVFNWNNAEQYIGFKDKNGNIIFEGDIIETPLKGFVKWNEETLQYDVIYEDDYECLCSNLTSEIKLLGNIHDVK